MPGKGTLTGVFALPSIYFDSRYPTILPGIVVSLAVAVMLAPRVARRLGANRWHAWVLVASLGVILALTIAPSRLALLEGPVGGIQCDTSRLLAPLATYLRRDDPLYNVLFFVPLGLAIGLLPRSRSRHALTFAAFLLSPAIELTQALVVAIGRACETGDIADNTLGLVIGLVLGNLLRRLFEAS